MPSTTAKMQQWQPRMPFLTSRSVRSWNSDVTRVRRPPQYGHRSRSSVSTSIRPQQFEQAAGLVDAGAVEVLGTEPPPRLLLVDLSERAAGSHLRLMAPD